MTCEAVRETICGTPSEEPERESRKGALHRHLQECAACREFLERNLALDRVLAGWQAPEPRTNMQARVMARIAQMERTEREKNEAGSFGERFVALLRHRFQVPAFGALLLMACLAASLAFNVAQFRGTAGPGEIRVSSNGQTEGVGTQPISGVVGPPLASTPHSPAAATRHVLYRAPDVLAGYGIPGLGAGAMPSVTIVILGSPPVLHDRSSAVSPKVLPAQDSTKEENEI